MQTNYLAEIWYQCIINGTKTFDDCPDTYKDVSVKPIVLELLKLNGHEELINS